MVALLWSKTWWVFALLAAWVAFIYLVKHTINRFKGVK